MPVQYDDADHPNDSVDTASLTRPASAGTVTQHELERRPGFAGIRKRFALWAFDLQVTEKKFHESVP